MPIKNRPTIKKPTAKQRQALEQQLQHLAPHLAAYRSRLHDAHSLIDGADCFRNLHSQITEIIGCLDEVIDWYSELDQKGLLEGLEFYSPGMLLPQLNFLGTPNPDQDDLDWTTADLEGDFGMGGEHRPEFYPPGMAASILDQGLDEFEDEEEAAVDCCLAKLAALEKDTALISGRLIDQIRTAGFGLYDEISRLGH